MVLLSHVSVQQNNPVNNLRMKSAIYPNEPSGAFLHLVCITSLHSIHKNTKEYEFIPLPTIKGAIYKHNMPLFETLSCTHSLEACVFAELMGKPFPPGSLPAPSTSSVPAKTMRCRHRWGSCFAGGESPKHSIKG